MDDIFRSYILPALIGSGASVLILIMGWFYGIYQMKKTMQSDKEKLETMIKHEVSQNNKNLSVQYITDKRVEWIYEVRNTISKLISELYYVSSEYKLEIKTIPIEGLKEMNYLHAKLRLLFNFTGDIDSRIIQLSNSLIRSINNAGFDRTKFSEEMMCLSELTQIYLKLEWDRVKIEASGNVDDQDMRQRLYRRKIDLFKSATHVNYVESDVD